MTNCTFTKSLTVVAVLGLFLAVGNPLAKADPVSVDPNMLALRAGHNVHLEAGVTVRGAIAAGNDVKAGQFANLRSIYVDDDIDLDRYATVRGTVLANDKAKADQGLNLIGSWTAKSVYFARDAHVVGNVTAGTGSLHVDRGATITGTSGRVGSAIDTFIMPSMGPEPDPGRYGSTNVREGNNASTALAAGSYRDVKFGRESTVSLSAGTYTMKEFSIERDSTINIDTREGDVVLNVKGGGLKAGRDTVFNKIGDGKLVINVFDGDMKLERNSRIEAVVSVWGGNFKADRETMMTGSVAVTGDIHFGTDSEFNFAGMGMSGGEVPEPTALAILAMGGVFAVMRRRHYRTKKAC